MPKLANSLIKNLRALMEQAGMTQADLSRVSGIAQPHISGYLTGKNMPGIESLQSLANGLGVPLAALLGDETPKSAPPRDPTPEEMALAVLTALKLPEDRLRGIRAILEIDPINLEPAIEILEEMANPKESARAAAKKDKKKGAV